MSQTEPAHTRSAIITELACISAELADMQVRNAEIATRVSRVIRDLSCTTAPVPPGEDLQQLRQRLDGVRGRLEATAREIRTSAERMPPAAQAAPPSGTSPSAQNAGEPVRARKALDVAPERESGIWHTSGQSRECVTSAGAGGASAASADTAPAADAPRVPRREPEVRNAGGGLVQDGGSLKPAAATVEKAPLVRDVILDAYATTTKTIAEIAEHSGSTRDSVKVTLNKARHKDEPRIKAGDDLRAPKTEPTLAPVAQPTARDVADAAKPIAEIPQPRPIPTGGIEIPVGKLIAIRGAEVHGPAGIWRTSKETAKAFSMLADGQLYGLETMARHGGLTPSVCVNLIAMWTAALAKIGIELHHHKGYGLRLRAIGGQA